MNLKNSQASAVQDDFRAAVDRLCTRDLENTEDSKTEVISVEGAYPKESAPKRIANQAVVVLEHRLNERDVAVTTRSSKTLRN